MAAEGVKGSEYPLITLPLDSDILEVMRPNVNNFRITWADFKGAIFTMDINVAIVDGADAALGAKADAVATTDTGTFSLISLFKRLLQSVTTLRGQLPAALVSGRLGVDVTFPATQAVSIAAVPLPSGAATSALQGTGNANLSSIDTKTPALSTGAVPVETIKALGVARQLAVTAASSAIALTTTCRRVSVTARGADMRIRVGTATGTAVQTDHLVLAGERVDFAVGATPWIMAIADTLSASLTGTLEITELL